MWEASFFEDYFEVQDVMDGLNTGRNGEEVDWSLDDGKRKLEAAYSIIVRSQFPDQSDCYENYE